MSLTVYFTIYFIMIICSYKLSSKKNIWSSVYVYIAILSFSLIVGLRWNVGMDYPAYYALIQGLTPEYELERIEFCPRIMMLFIQKHHLPFYLWFIVMASIQISCFYIAINKLCKRLLPWCCFILLFFFLEYFLNIVRQGTALMIALCALAFYLEKRWLLAFLFCLFSYSFHHSSAIILFIIVVDRIKKIPSVNFQILIFTLSIIIGATLMPIVISKFGLFTELIGYNKSVDDVLSQDLQVKKGSGLFVLFNYLIYYLIIFNSNRMQDNCNEVIPIRKYTLFYNCFFIGICLYSSTMNNMLLSRIAMYFNISSIIIISLYLYINMKGNALKRTISLSIIAVYGFTIFLKVFLSDDWQFVSSL